MLYYQAFKLDVLVLIETCKLNDSPAETFKLDELLVETFKLDELLVETFKASN